MRSTYTRAREYRARVRARTAPSCPLFPRVAINVRPRGEGLVTATIDELRRARANQVSCCRDGILPLRRRFGSEGPQRGPGDEVALKIERVVDGGMDTEEALRGSS